MIKINYGIANIDEPIENFDLALIPVNEDKDVVHYLNECSESIIKRVSEAAKREDFNGSFGQRLPVKVDHGGNLHEVLLVGCGRSSRLTDVRYQSVLEKCSASIAKHRADRIVSSMHSVRVRKRSTRWKIEQFIFSQERRGYRYNAGFDAHSILVKPRKTKIQFRTRKSKSKEASKVITMSTASARAISIARNLGDLPANICKPDYLATFAQTLGSQHDAMQCSVLNESELEQLGMGAILAVSKGSNEPANMIVLEYKGAGESERPYCLIGKGVTFDSGGLSIKPAAAMERMKFDMCGAASVLAAANAAAELKLPINLLVLVPCSENMTGGSAVKPGDVITTLSGMSVEILNTDAEGRLLLCDALHYSKRFNPRATIDVATLTGASVQALGKHIHALFSNSSSLARSLTQAGESVSDVAWQMPLADAYNDGIKSKFADMSNVGGEGGGAIVAASFLERFIGRRRWAHLDIAGTSTKRGVGATGRPVALLVRYLSKLP